MRPTLISLDTESTGIFAFEWPNPSEVSKYFSEGTRRNSIFARSARAEPRGLARPFMVGYYDGKEARTYRVGKESLDPVKVLCEDPSVTKVLHNAYFDLIMLNFLDIHLRGPLEDTMLGLTYIYPGNRMIPLKEIARNRLGFKTTWETKLDHWIQFNTPRFVKENGREPGFHDAPDHIIRPYLSEDVEMTYKVYKSIEKELKAGPYYNLYKIECGLTPHITRSYIRGIPFSRSALVQASARCTSYLKSYKSEIEALGFPDLNPQSSTQVNKVLFGSLGLQPKDLTPGGKPSTRGSFLEKYDHPLPKLIYKYRQVSKVQSSHIKAMLILMDKDSLLHPDFMIQGAGTGRMASKNPNFQNLKQVQGRTDSETGVGVWLRKALKVRPGTKLWSFDYKQIEFRILAHYSNDPKLLDILVQGKDPHGECAKILFGSYDEKKRIMVKEFHFGLLYGMGIKSLSDRMGVSYDEGKKIINNYYLNFPGVKAIQSRIVQGVRLKGLVQSILGRSIPVGKDFAYTGVNYLCQGSASDILKVGYFKVSEYLQKVCKEALVLFSIHDDLEIEIPEGKEVKLLPSIKTILEASVPLRVPTPVDCKVYTKDWYKSEEVEWI